MSKLLIEKLAEEVEQVNTEETAEIEKKAELDKEAEEAAMEKLAEEISVLDESRTLIAVGEEMYKIATELENEGLQALAIDTYQLGERMGACLTKTAAEDGSGLLEALDIAEDMNKIAEVYATIADEVEDETLAKMAEAVISISNGLTEDANEVYKLAAEEENEEVKEEEKVEEVKEEEKVEEVEKEAGVKSNIAKFLRENSTGEYGHGTLKGKLKMLATREGGLKAVGKDAAVYGGSAAALASAGYAAKKIHDKK